MTQYLVLDDFIKVLFDVLHQHIAFLWLQHLKHGFSAVLSQSFDSGASGPKSGLCRAILLVASETLDPMRNGRAKERSEILRLCVYDCRKPFVVFVDHSNRVEFSHLSQ